MIPAEALPEPAPASPENPNDVRISLAALAEGIKPGDKVEFRVVSLDPAKDQAVLSPLKDLTPSLEGDSVPEEAIPSPDGKAPSQDMNTDVLLGPMNKLKGYLMKKSQNVSRSEAP